MPRKFLTNNWLMAGLALALLVFGVCLSVSCKNFQWLSRFGALVICTGVITLARPSILGEDIKGHVIMTDTGLSHLDPEHWKNLENHFRLTSKKTSSLVLRLAGLARLCASLAPPPTGSLTYSTKSWITHEFQLGSPAAVLAVAKRRQERGRVFA